MIAAAIGAADVDWEETTLGSLCKRNGGLIQTGPFGSQLHASDYVDDGIPAVMPVNIGDNRIVEDGIARISEEDAERLSRHRLRSGDIVYSRRGDVERRAFVTEHERGWLCGTGCLMVRTGNKAVDARFISYWLGHPVIREWIVRHAVGATMANLNTGILSDVPVLLPPLPIQYGIAAALGALDDKIKSNRQLIKLMQQVIAAEVEFAEGSDWADVSVSSLASFVNGGAYTKGATGTGRMVIRIAELNSGPGPSTVYNDLNVPEYRLARPGDLLMSWSGSLGVYRWSRDEAIINQHIFKVIPEKYPTWLVHDRLLQVMPIFQGIAKDKATTMGHIQRGHLERTMIEVPPSDEIERLDYFLAPLWSRLLVADREALKLVAFRDVLLPELLSGRLRVPVAHDVVGNSV